jgi:GWxTD domain-containing protein
MVLEPESSDLWYYLEMYPAKGKPFNGNASMVVRRSSDNTELTRRELQKLVDVKVAQPIAGKVSLEGLPDGEYTFDVVLQLADTTVVSSHPFRMGMPAVVADAGSGAASGYFYTIPDNEIETTYGAAVMFNMTKQEVDLYNTLSTNAKRAFLTRMFGTAAPDPKRKPESALDAFLSRAQTVQAKYSERSGRGRMEGWKTDRGRIYIRRGEPTNLVSRPAARSGSPYEIFFYGNNRGLFYLFSDDTRAGNYRLIYTNDPQEQSLPNWDRHVGSEAVEDMRSMGIRVTVNGGNSGGQ